MKQLRPAISFDASMECLANGSKILAIDRGASLID
jgi:hypothetical protein